MDYQEYLCLENIVDLMACKAWLTENWPRNVSSDLNFYTEGFSNEIKR